MLLASEEGAVRAHLKHATVRFSNDRQATKVRGGDYEEHKKHV